MSKIEKTIARQKEKIQEGQYYEAHQQLRVIASRYLKSENYNAAVDILSGGAQLLLTAGQGGSGGDLCMFLIDIYHKAELKPDAASKHRLLSLLRAFPADEPTRKRFIGEMIGWSSKYGEFPAGDPELHHVAGQLLAQDADTYDAERHLILGTRDSAGILAELEYRWYKEDEAHTAPLYAARGVLPLLIAHNVRAANQFLLLFTSQLSKDNPSLSVQQVSSSRSDLRVYSSLPLLNFLSLLLLAVQKATPEIFKSLVTHYSPQVDEVGTWDEALSQIAEMYFDISRPRQSNPLFDMMGSMFGGGGGSAPTSGSKPKPKPRLDAPGVD